MAMNQGVVLDDAAKLGEIALLTHPMTAIIRCFYQAMERQPPDKDTAHSLVIGIDKLLDQIADLSGAR